ncbi:hypothetical protein HY970_01790 [Candidatus Kaiserbacteria bacterium]|nr:hypothetical protein [Candidatus Kaiserbacteria bacterium]
MDPDKQRLEEIYRLERENNRMLHGMRRRAFWGGIVKMLIYMAALGVPVWIYFAYLAPIMQEMMHTYQQIQGTGARAQVQFNEFQNAWEAFKKQF